MEATWSVAAAIASHPLKSPSGPASVGATRRPATTRRGSGPFEATLGARGMQQQQLQQPSLPGSTSTMVKCALTRLLIFSLLALAYNLPMMLTVKYRDA